MNEEKKRTRSIVIWSITAFFAVIIMWWISLYVLRDMPERGTFGDMFGAVNALFSGLAFAGVIIAILLQSQELKAQRLELELTRGQIEGQKEALEAQNKTFIKQRFENTFFQMLSLHNEIIDSMIIPVPGQVGTAQGRSALKFVASSISEKINRALRDNPRLSGVDVAVEGYERTYQNSQSYLGHYFRILYRIVKFIDQSDVEDKKFYTNIVRAQLSNQELQLLFYNCLTPSLGKEKFKPLVEKYALLNNLEPRGIHNPHDTIRLYDAQAYGGNYPSL